MEDGAKKRSAWAAFMSVFDWIPNKRTKLDVAPALTTKKLNFAPALTTELERELWKDFVKMADDALSLANLPNFDDLKNEQEKQQRALFGDNLKNTFIFNPLCCTDLRFMRQTDIWGVNDKVYKFMSNEVKAGPSFKLYLLRAISGAGKTGTILNAVARQDYLIYMQCDTNKGGVARDYTDANTKTLAEELDKAISNSPGLSNEAKKTIAECHCTIFWLASILILAALKEKHSYTPEQWIFWSNSGDGKAIIQTLQLQLISKFNEKDNPETMSSALNAVLREAIKQVQYPCGKLWLGIDEAQILQHTIIGDTQLLHILAFDAIPANAIGLHTIVAGTQMPSFANYLVHTGGVAKKLSVFDLATSTIGYPYVTSEQALALLDHHFDMTDIKADAALLGKVKYSLQGRLRNVVRFLQLLQEKRTEDRNLSFKELFGVALNALNGEIKEYIDERLNLFLEKPEIKEKSLNEQ